MEAALEAAPTSPEFEAEKTERPPRDAAA
jgi:hypothetical protein